MSKNYLPELDGIRGISILLVLFCHSLPNFLPGGWIGVDVFFVLSGFLITSNLILDCDRKESSGFKILKEFYLSRIFRLMPALFFMIFLTYIIRSYFINEDYQFKRILSPLFYYSNWAYAYGFSTKIGFSNDADPYREHTHTWSLSIEEQFYLAWPLIILCMRFLAKDKKKFFLLGLITSSTIFWTITHFQRYNISQNLTEFTPLQIYVRTDSRLDGLSLGIFLAAIRGFLANIWKKKSEKYLKISILVSPYILAGSLLSLIGLSYVASYTSIAFMRYIHPLISFIPIIWILLVLTKTPGTGLFRSKLLKWLGKYSYSIYLYNLPVIVFVPTFLSYFKFDSAFNNWNYMGLGFGILTIVITLLFAYFSFNFIEKPLRRWWKNHIQHNQFKN